MTPGMARFCGKCGTQARIGARFCEKCGAWVGEEVGTPSTAVAAISAAPIAAPLRTITREYNHERDRDRDIAQMGSHGWSVQSITHVPGSYLGGRGCLLAVIFLPLALLAGNSPDRYLVTFGTTAPASQAKLPAQITAGGDALQKRRQFVLLMCIALIALLLWALRGGQI